MATLHTLPDLVTQHDRQFFYVPAASLLVFQTRKETTTYTVTEMATAVRSFRIEKEDGEVYVVSGQGCTCKGWQYRGQCRHHEAVTELVSTGEL